MRRVKPVGDSDRRIITGHVKIDNRVVIIRQHALARDASMNSACPEVKLEIIYLAVFFYDLGTISPGGAGRNRVMNKTDFLKLRVQYPALDEQKHISDFLKTLDSQIEVLKSLLTNYIWQKSGLMQTLLSGAITTKNS